MGKIKDIAIAVANGDGRSKKYVGPFVKKGHVLGGRTYNPETMTDEEIGFFQQLVPESKDWWITSTDLPENTENEGSENLTYDT